MTKKFEKIIEALKDGRNSDQKQNIGLGLEGMIEASKMMGHTINEQLEKQLIQEQIKLLKENGNYHHAEMMNEILKKFYTGVA